MINEAQMFYSAYPTIVVSYKISFNKKTYRMKKRNPPLSSCSAGSLLYIHSNPNLLPFEMAEKLGKRRHPHFDS